MCQTKDILNTLHRQNITPSRICTKELFGNKFKGEQIKLKLFNHIPPGSVHSILSLLKKKCIITTVWFQTQSNSTFSSRSQLTCESASAYTRTMSSVPEGRTKARASLYFFTRSLIASWSPGGVTACLSASVVLITLLSAT